jgi:phage terminase large subunit-like protein
MTPQDADALDVLSASVLPDGRRWGEAATEGQWSDARAVLCGSAPYSYLTRARGYSKTTDLAAIALAAMATQLPPRSRSYAMAADRDQGRLLLDAADGFILRTPVLHGRFQVDAWRITDVPTDSMLDVLAADAASSWGLMPALAIVDELGQWGTTSGPRRLFESVASAVAKNPQARLAIISTASDPAHWARRILDHAYADPLWRVNEIPGPPPWMDPDRLEEQRRRLPESSYRRLFLNEWTSPEDRLSTAEDLRTCVTLDGPQEPKRGTRYVVALDLGVTHDRTVAAVCHGEPVEGERERRRVVMDRMRVWAGSRARPVGLSAIEEWVAEASRRYNRAPLVLDPWQAIALAQRLRYRGMTVVEFAFSSQSVGRLAVTLHTLIRDHLLALPDDPDLIDELANVRLREVSPGVLRIDHDADQHDDRAIALALAAQRLVERAPRPVGRLAMSGGRRVPGSGWRMSGGGGGWHVGGSG